MCFVDWLARTIVFSPQNILQAGYMYFILNSEKPNFEANIFIKSNIL